MNGKWGLTTKVIFFFGHRFPRPPVLPPGLPPGFAPGRPDLDDWGRLPDDFPPPNEVDLGRPPDAAFPPEAAFPPVVGFPPGVGLGRLGCEPPVFFGAVGASDESWATAA